MFKSLDQSIFDDSTGLKLLEYLTQDGKRNAGPRGRKALFQKQISEATLDDFTVRNINIPETTPIVLRNKPLTRNQHSQDSTISVNKSSFVSLALSTFNECGVIHHSISETELCKYACSRHHSEYALSGV